MTRIGPPNFQNIAIPASRDRGVSADAGTSAVSQGQAKARDLAGAASRGLTDISSATISVEILAAIKALQGSGEERQRAAFRIFLRHKLASTLRTHQGDEGQLDALTDEVIALMNTDAELRSSVVAAGKALVERYDASSQV